MSCVAWAPQSLMQEPMRDLVRTRATADRGCAWPGSICKGFNYGTQGARTWTVAYWHGYVAHLRPGRNNRPADPAGDKMSRDHLAALAAKLTSTDHLVIEATGNAHAAADVVAPFIGHVVIAPEKGASHRQSGSRRPCLP
jgi:hypothetical protein